MPRERVASEPDGSEIEVLWTPDRDVQIGIIQPSWQRMFLVDDRTSDERARIGEIAGAAVLDNPSDASKAVGDAIFEALTDYRGMYSPSLSRYECNQLIQQMRRARNAVHGRDE